MKIRVMIVEDEPIIRVGISKVIQWEEINCQVVALAENGEEGLELAKKYQPELVVSDIRMPKKDGLTMVEELKKQFPGLQVVLLTGYKDFEYAQRAITYGVSDYVLKPVDQDELFQTLKKLAQKIQEVRAEENEREQLKAKVHESLPILKDKFLSNLLFHTPQSIYNVYDKMEFFNIHIHEFVLIAVEIDAFYELEREFTENDIQILFFLIEEQMEKLLEQYEYNAVSFTHGKTVYAIVDSKDKTLEKGEISEYGKELSRMVEAKGRFTVSIGISDIHSGAEQVRRARQEADQCTVQSYYLGRSSVVCYHDVQTMTGVTENACEVETKNYYDAVKKGVDIFQEAELLCGQLENIKSMALIKSIVTEIISRSYRIAMEEFGTEPEILEAFDETMAKVYLAVNYQNYRELVEETARRTENYIKKKRVSKAQFIIDKALAYMQENCRRELSLEEVAEHLYISKWYFSKLFRKETGSKFKDYLSELRIREAQKIIRENPGLRNYEVSEMLGFGNPRYFSELFKKVTGLTPSEYRG